MEKYEFTGLGWLGLPDKDAAKASKWYQGSGWYFNPVDERGELQPPRLITESASDAIGRIQALRICGQEGWFVAAFIPAPAEGMWERLVSGIIGPDHVGPHFILQRRIDG